MDEQERAIYYWNARWDLENEYRKWLEKRLDLNDCAFNVITFLWSKGYLDVGKINHLDREESK